MPDTFLGFDYSRNKIGVAVGQTLTNSATPLTTLINHDKRVNWDAIQQLIEQWRPKGLIVGLPYNIDGSEQDTSATARDFGKQLEKRCHLPVYFIDERLTSREASQILGYNGHTSPLRQAKTGRKVKKNKQRGIDIDQVAAQLILQSWLNQQ